MKNRQQTPPKKNIKKAQVKKTVHYKSELSKTGIVIEMIRKILVFAIGIFISWYLFDKCLFCPNCNSFVIIHFSLISFTCFVSCGVPIDKIISINSVAGG